MGDEDLLCRLLSSPRGASRNFWYERYGSFPNGGIFRSGFDHLLIAVPSGSVLPPAPFKTASGDRSSSSLDLVLVVHVGFATNVCDRNTIRPTLKTPPLGVLWVL